LDSSTVEVTAPEPAASAPTTQSEDTTAVDTAVVSEPTTAAVETDRACTAGEPAPVESAAVESVSGMVLDHPTYGEIMRTPAERFADLPGYPFAPHYVDVDPGDVLNETCGSGPGSRRLGRDDHLRRWGSPGCGDEPTRHLLDRLCRLRRTRCGLGPDVDRARVFAHLDPCAGSSCSLGKSTAVIEQSL
jgi:hypothetical protein